MKFYYKKVSVVFACFFLLQVGINRMFSQTYKDATAPIEKRVEDLVQRMTLQEKVAQLNQLLLGENNNPNNSASRIKRIPAEVGSLLYGGTSPTFRNSVQRKAMEESRLGIPILFGFDVIHGFRTIFPIPLAQSCSWNPELVKQACSIAARETKSAGVDWTFSPMIDVARDPRWGRVAEGYGEDPYLTSIFSVASVEGYQGTDLSGKSSIAACLKHYVGYGASEGGRDYVYTEISQQSLWDTYLPPFEAGVKAGAATLMSAFNDISGVPTSANHYTLTEVLKEKWGHDGFVVSDWESIKQLINQGVASSKKEAALKAFNAGVEMDMVDRCYQDYMEELVNEGSVSKERLDDAVKRILRVKFRLGLFDKPYAEEKKDEERFLLSEDLKIAEKLAEESIVLLKNEKQTLPLSLNTRIALIGPMAKNKDHLLGSWCAYGDSVDVTSIYEALEKEFANKQIEYALGCDFDGDETSGFATAVDVALKADVVVLCLGEKRGWSGENASRANMTLPDIQQQLLAALAKTEKPIVLLLSNGRPLELYRLEPYCNAIVEMWQPGVAGGKPVVGILSGRINPSGKLSMTFPYSANQIPIYYNMRQSSRPIHGKYQDIPSVPFYEFGHGLSYSTFTYSDIILNKNTINTGESLTASIVITNDSKRDGTEVVQLYIRDIVGSISRPIKELKGFQKIFLRAGEQRKVIFQITPELLKYYNNDLGYIIEPGEFEVMIGGNSYDVKKIGFQLNGK